MAIYESFCIEYEFKRFLLRCPKLAAAPQFDNLLKKGKNLIEDELIDVVSELLLHPRYTIPLIGCFRPISRKIIDRVVALLRLVSDLTSNSNDLMLDFDEGSLFSKIESSDCEEIVSVINLYVKCERGLRLHELSCLAFSRTLDLVPYLSVSVRDYFKFAPSPFKRIMEKEGVHLLDAVRVSYRLLLAEPVFFSKLWNGSCFLDLVHKITSFDGGISDILMDVRWCAVQILTVVLKTSDMTTSEFGFDDEIHDEEEDETMKINQIGAFSVLKELVVVLPDCLADHIGSIIPGIEKALCEKSSTSNLKIEALVFTRLVLASHSPAVFHPYIKAFAVIAASPLHLDLSCVLDHVIGELTACLRKANRALRQATLGTLNTLIVAYGDKICSAANEVIIVKLSTLRTTKQDGSDVVDPYMILMNKENDGF